MKYHLAIKKNELDLSYCSGQRAIVSLHEKSKLLMKVYWIISITYKKDKKNMQMLVLSTIFHLEDASTYLCCPLSIKRSLGTWITP